MKESRNLIRLLAIAIAVLSFAVTASAQEEPVRFRGRDLLRRRLPALS